MSLNQLTIAKTESVANLEGHLVENNTTFALSYKSSKK